MNEDVFLLSFLPLVLISIAIAPLCLRYFKYRVDWERFRLSSLLWVTMTSLISLGFINMTDSYLDLGTWIGISVFLGIRVTQHHDVPCRILRVIWIGLVVLPIAGWILYFRRFPHFNAIEAETARLGLEPLPSPYRWNTFSK